MRRPSPAAYSMMFMARFTSPWASDKGFPSSRVMVRAMSSPRWRKISIARNRTPARMGAGVPAQPANASWAASTAFRASSTPEVWNSPNTVSLLAGL